MTRYVYLGEQTLVHTTHANLVQTKVRNGEYIDIEDGMYDPDTLKRSGFIHAGDYTPPVETAVIPENKESAPIDTPEAPTEPSNDTHEAPTEQAIITEINTDQAQNDAPDNKTAKKSSK